MINATELRVGNILDNGHHIVHVTSTSLDIDDEYQPQVGVCKFGEHRDEVVIREAAFNIEIKPIPLTPEWLERCGFVDNLPWAKGNLRLDGDNRLHVVDHTGYGIIIARNVEYLHQLQNLFFALAGEELNVKL